MKNNIIFLTGGTGLVGKKLISDLNLKRFNIYFTSRNKKSIIEIEEIYKKSKYFLFIHSFTRQWCCNIRIN